jgi:GNAT superfamily N-acetyltransferase
LWEIPGGAKAQPPRGGWGELNLVEKLPQSSSKTIPLFFTVFALRRILIEMENVRQWKLDDFVLSTDKSLLQIPRIHAFLSTHGYWCLGIPQNVVEKAVSNSLCFGLYDLLSEGQQVGYARVVSDKATFAWICDVYVEASYRGRGLSKWMMDCILKYPDLQNLRRVLLGTQDAHGLYKKFGFEVPEKPQNFMEIKDNDIYKKDQDQGR